MNKNGVDLSFANVDSVAPSHLWNSKSQEQRIDILQNSVNVFLNNNNSLHNFEIIVREILDSGFITLIIKNDIGANERGVLLLDLELYLKDKIEPGLTVWLEPYGDKSVLRKLRGIEIKS